MSTTEGVWLSISDYSRYKDVSISTIRRHIKTNILKHKEENGKYFIYVPSQERVKAREEEEILKLKLELELLKMKLKEIQEENNEFRMLVEIYENKVSTEIPPELPQIL